MGIDGSMFTYLILLLSSLLYSVPIKSLGSSGSGYGNIVTLVSSIFYFGGGIFLGLEQQQQNNLDRHDLDCGSVSYPSTYFFGLDIV